MSRLVLLMLRNRWAQALTLAVLAMVATAAAVASPAYVGAVDRAVVDREVRAASPQELSMSISTSVSKDPSDDPDESGVDFSRIGSVLIGMPGFTPVFSIDVTVLGVEKAASTPTRLVYRQDVCAHLVMVAGRCLVGGSEVVIGQATAARAGIRAGATVTVQYAVADPRQMIYVPQGGPDTLTVAGIYRVPDPGALYWGSHGYFTADSTGGTAEPAFTSRTVFDSLEHAREQDTVDVLGSDGAFTAGNLPAVGDNLRDVSGRVFALAGQVSVDTQIPALLDRIDRERELAHELVPVAGVPVVALAWFVIFLAVGYGTGSRRFELGLVALRGASVPSRWVLAAGEYLVAIVLGALVGYPVGLAVSAALATAWLDGPGTGAGTLEYGLAAGAGAVLAALLAQRRELLAPVSDLLRRVSGGARRWRSLAVEAVVVVLALVAAVQLRVTDGQLDGVGMLVPALVILAVALLAGRAVVPLAARYGARALRRGRTGGALAALQLGRRPGAHRLFVLLAVAVALLGFAATGYVVAGQARAAAAEVTTGAPRVLDVGSVTRLKLLNATRAIDPGGRYAMAVAKEPDPAPGDPPELAVDTTRLAAVANWRPDFGGPGPAALAALLRPGLPDPMIIRAGAIELDVTADRQAIANEVHLLVVLAPLSGAEPLTEDLGRLSVGDQRLVTTVNGCATGCRLVGIDGALSGAGGFQLQVVLHQVRTIEPDGVALSSAQLANVSAWQPQMPRSIGLSGGAQGLTISYHTVNGSAADSWIHPADRPDRLPVAATVPMPGDAQLIGLDARSTPVTEVARLAGMPRLGSNGVLVDLEYADRAASDGGTATGEQVWLGPAAPPDVVARLLAQGVVVTGDSGVARLRAWLDGQGPALALWFYPLAGGLGMLLAAGASALVAAVDRDRRAADLWALRVQGMSRSVAGRAGLWGYLVVVLCAAVVGLLAAAVAWAVAGPDLPMFVDRTVPWPPPVWPHPGAVLWSWAGALALLIGVAVAAGYDLRRRVRRHGQFEAGRDLT
jgi:hypothetical protein